MIRPKSQKSNQINLIFNNNYLISINASPIDIQLAIIYDQIQQHFLTQSIKLNLNSEKLPQQRGTRERQRGKPEHRYRRAWRTGLLLGTGRFYRRGTGDRL
ncbi:hypothetical protein Hanom_Chr13g01227441 [Helianthus anomalus]